jgi:hypothetical protein
LVAGVAATVVVLVPLPADAAGLTWTETPTGIKSGAIDGLESGGGALWAVGWRSPVNDPETMIPLALRRDGTRWASTPLPWTAGRLLDVETTGPNDAWAVGSAADVDEPRLAAHWDGSSWKALPLPPRPATEHGPFTAVTTVAGSTYFAAGNGFGQYTSISRYDGHNWTSLTDPVIAKGTYIGDLLAFGPDDLWAAAFEGIFHYDGKRWSRTPLPGGTPGSGSPEGVHVEKFAATGPNDIWAVGTDFRPGRRTPLVLHYDGKTWSDQAPPRDTAQLFDVELVNGHPVAIGEWLGSGGSYILQGTTEGLKKTTPPAGYLTHASAVADGRLWIGGSALPKPGDDPLGPFIAAAPIEGAR